MATRYFKTGEEALEAAKKKVQESYPGIPRKFLEASPEDSYKDSHYHVTVLVLGGYYDRKVKA